MSKIKIRKYRIPFPKRLGKPEKPIRIVVIGDLHNRTFGEGNSRLVEKIVQQYPDMVLSVGDLTVCRHGKEANPDVGLSLLKRLSCECPVYCVNGNHEYRAKILPDLYPGVYDEMKRQMKRMNIHLLENQEQEVEIKGVSLMIHGLEIPEKYYKRFSKEYMPAEEIREKIGEPDKKHYHILLAHNPVFFDSYALWGADLTLGGHLHGGLIRLPFVGGLVSPQVKLFPKYDCGLYQKYGRKMVVTAGLGTHSLAIRFNNPAEITLLELY